MVWQMTTPEAAQEEAVRMTVQMHSMSSWAWVDPGLETGQSHGWWLKFHLEVQAEYLVLTLVPTPEGPPPE